VKKPRVGVQGAVRFDIRRRVAHAISFPARLLRAVIPAEQMTASWIALIASPSVFFPHRRQRVANELREREVRTRTRVARIARRERRFTVSTERIWIIVPCGVFI